MKVPAELASAVWLRAQQRCEYCRMHQALQGATFHVEHIVPRAKGGETNLANLALACPGCNLRKADRVEAIDALTSTLQPLFHPRRDVWSDHFRWSGDHVEGVTAGGRATVAALDLNHPRRVRIREAERNLCFSVV